MKIDAFVSLLGARTILAGALALAIVPAGAEAAPIPLNVHAIGQSAPAHRICESVLQLQPADALFQNCTSSLEESLRSAGHARAVSQGRDACFASSARRDIADLDLCLLRVEAAPDAEDMQLLSTALDGTRRQPDAMLSFQAAAPDVKLGREQRACAIVGFDPAFPAFARCTSNLQDALGNSDVAAREGDGYSID